jgi:uncharacterized membrane protein
MDRISEILNDPHKTALLGAATGAVKGVVVGKVLLFTAIGAASGAAFGAGLSWLNRRGVAKDGGVGVLPPPGTAEAAA